MATVDLTVTLSGEALCGASPTASVSLAARLDGEASILAEPPVVVRAVIPILTKDAALATRFATYSRQVSFLGDFDLDALTVCHHNALGDVVAPLHLGIDLGDSDNLKSLFCVCPSFLQA